jgi:hypothetical protein
MRFSVALSRAPQLKLGEAALCVADMALRPMTRSSADSTLEDQIIESSLLEILIHGAGLEIGKLNP